MYTYQGYGMVVSIANAGGAKTFIGYFNPLFHTEFNTLEEIDDSMLFGTYESADNVDYASVNNFELDTTEGIFIVNLPETLWSEQEKEERESIHYLMHILGYGADWLDDDHLVGNYLVECEQ